MSDEEKLSDVQLTHLFVAKHGKHIRFIPEWDSWMVWNGKVWESDKGAIQVQHLAKDISGSHSMIRKVISLARDEVMVSPDEFDADPYLINTPLGVIHLHVEDEDYDPEVGVWNHYQDHVPGDYCTKMTGVPFDPTEEPTAWLRYLEEVQPDPEVREYLQRWCGYFLLGKINQHEMLVLLGEGANGKSVFVDVLLGVLGTYAKPGQQNLLIEKRVEDHLESVAATKSLRLCVVSETPERARLNESRVKTLTAGDRVAARRMYENQWEFTPTAKLLMMSNHRPVISGTDEGIWRRIRIVPWNVTIPTEKQTQGLAQHLIKFEGPMILAWMMEGYYRYCDNGLTMPTTIEETRKQFRQESDAIGQFLEEGGYEIGVGEVRSSILYTDLDQFCKLAGITPPQRNERRKGFERHGFTYRTSVGLTYVTGLQKVTHEWSV